MKIRKYYKNKIFIKKIFILAKKIWIFLLIQLTSNKKKFLILKNRKLIKIKDKINFWIFNSR